MMTTPHDDTLTNAVDTSDDTIHAEFEAAADAIGLSPESGIPAAESEQLSEIEREAQIAIAQSMIQTTLKFSIGLFAQVTLETEHTEQAAKAYAVLIVKYFPGGIFGFLDRYKEELGAVTATVMLIKVVSQAKAKQQAEQDAAEAAKKPEGSATSATNGGGSVAAGKGAANG